MNRSDDLFPQPGGTPDPYWQRAFEDAADTPPLRVWEGVERQLDLDESDGILPLWQHREGRQSMLFGRWVAGIAASLLLTALGWWAWHREDAIRPEVSVAVSTPPSQTLSRTSSAPAGPYVAKADATTEQRVAAAQFEPVAKPTRRQNSRRQAGEMGTVAATSNAIAQAGRPMPEARLNLPDNAQDETVLTETTTITMHVRQTELAQPTATGLQPSAMGRSFTSQSFSMQSVRIQSPSGQLPPTTGQLAGADAILPAPGQAAMPTFTSSSERLAMAVDPLPTKPLVIHPLGNDRIVWYRNGEPTAEPATPASRKDRQRPWLSAGVLASAFNPAVAARSTFSPATNSFQSNVAGNASSAVSTLQSQIGRAVAFQAGLGVPLDEHWSIETGVGYLSGQNQVQSPARMASLTSANKAASGADNLYVDLIAHLGNNSSLAAYSAGISNNYSADALLANQASNYALNQPQTVSNLYQFVQVPVQIGYELRPRRKFGLAVLTGMVSNWFVRNTVAESITIKANDGVFRPVTLAGTAGMRLRYRPDNHWSASVAGTFQQSLQSLTRTEVSLQAQPQQVGLSFSVDRHF